MFGEYNGEEKNILENFYQLNKLEEQKQLCAFFAKCYEKSILPSINVMFKL